MFQILVIPVDYLKKETNTHIDANFHILLQTQSQQNIIYVIVFIETVKVCSLHLAIN